MSLLQLRVSLSRISEMAMIIVVGLLVDIPAQIKHAHEPDNCTISLRKKVEWRKSSLCTSTIC